ncbi:MAG: hypothetical protein AVDCRST_MAG88-1942, partial [uncultured Thermomicrobiales bacterium]
RGWTSRSPSRPDGRACAPWYAAWRRRRGPSQCACRARA